MADTRLRPARRDDCRRIAELFRLSSDGVADYVWSLTPEPGLSPIEIGARRYAREGVDFSYQNCLVIEHGGEVIGMAHAYVIPEPEPGDAPPSFEGVDPVLRPYAELEAPGSLYLSGMAVLAEHRGRGLGTGLLAAAFERARTLGRPLVSLLCFEANAGASRLYMREGFRAIDRRPVVPHPLIHHAGDVLLMTAAAEAVGRAGRVS